MDRLSTVKGHQLPCVSPLRLPESLSKVPYLRVARVATTIEGLVLARQAFVYINCFGFGFVYRVQIRVVVGKAVKPGINLHVRVKYLKVRYVAKVLHRGKNLA